MDDARFDLLVQRLSGLLSRRFGRRGAAGVGLAALLGAIGGDGIDARRRRRRRRCGPCQVRQGRRCRPKPDGTTCGDCLTCLAGACRAPLPNGTPCADCLVCNAGQCITVAADGTPCGVGGQCGTGRCFPPPQCLAANANCETVPAGDCCSGRCVLRGFAAVCDLSQEGDSCLSDLDCFNSSLACRMFTCVTR